MAKYRKKPVVISAFRYKRGCHKPVWFYKGIIKNELSLTENEKYGFYITIYHEDGSESRCNEGDYLIRNKMGDISSMGNYSFRIEHEWEEPVQDDVINEEG